MAHAGCMKPSSAFLLGLNCFLTLAYSSLDLHEVTFYWHCLPYEVGVDR